jgi:predicted translin family RNA/ssDNA-binding protein
MSGQGEMTDHARTNRIAVYTRVIDYLEMTTDSMTDGEIRQARNMAKKLQKSIETLRKGFRQWSNLSECGVVYTASDQLDILSPSYRGER